MDINRTITPSGSIHLAKTSNLGDLRRRSSPGLLWHLRNFPNRLRGFPADAAAHFLGSLTGVIAFRSRLSGITYRRPMDLPIEIAQRLRALLAENVDVRELARHFGGSVTDYGVLSTRLVTDAGVAFIVDALHASATIANLKYHGFGSGTTNEAAGDTALVTEYTTEYTTNNTRPTGSQGETSANIYSTVGTFSPDSGGTLAVTEHGVFDQAANSGGTLLDRSKFSAVNLVATNGDSLQVTYLLTLPSGN